MRLLTLTRSIFSILLHHRGVEDRTLDPLGEHLVENCGKLSMVDKLLKRLYERGHRVLIFTQMTRVLDIMEDFMVMRGYKYCRIDGNTTYEDRESQIDDFNKEGSEYFCFILSTRAGGLGINLQTADTCSKYWNLERSSFLPSACCCSPSALFISSIRQRLEPSAGGSIFSRFG